MFLLVNLLTQQKQAEIVFLLWSEQNSSRGRQITFNQFIYQNLNYLPDWAVITSTNSQGPLTSSTERTLETMLCSFEQSFLTNN